MENKSSSVQKNWAIIGTVTVIICILIGLYFYNNFFRQSNAQLIETVPTDASFIFQVNDNRTFVHDIAPFLPYLNELLNLNSFPGFEFFMDQLQVLKNEFIISGHPNGDKYSILYSCRINEQQFQQLVENLKIDPRNFINFNECKIYSYGTHYKKFNFTYHKGIFSISEDPDVLKKSIAQLESTRNLLVIKNFKRIFDIVNKNQKQNWMIINNAQFFIGLHQIIKDEFHSFFSPISNNPLWSAYQIRFNDDEISMMGYSVVEEDFQKMLNDQPSQINNFGTVLPFNTTFYATYNTPKPIQFLKAFQNNKNYVVSLSNYNQLLPQKTTYFSINQDSLSYYYIAFQIDTNRTPINAFVHPDSNFTGNIYSIIPSKLTEIYPHMNIRFKSEQLSYFILYKDYCIFSSTKEALIYYQKVIPNNNIESSPYYRFAKTNLPSEFTYEFFLAASSSHKWDKYFREESKKMKVYNDLKLITYSHTQPKDQLIGINFFIKF
jgi:hypothetical protein